jgi:hypothetical protein
VSCRNETFSIVVPRATTCTWTMPYRVWIASPANVRVADAAEDEGVAAGVLPLLLGSGGAVLVVGVGAGADVLALGRDADGRACDVTVPWVLKLSKATRPTMVPEMASSTRVMNGAPGSEGERFVVDLAAGHSGTAQF